MWGSFYQSGVHTRLGALGKLLEPHTASLRNSQNCDSDQSLDEEEVELGVLTILLSTCIVKYLMGVGGIFL